MEVQFVHTSVQLVVSMHFGFAFLHLQMNTILLLAMDESKNLGSTNASFQGSSLMPLAFFIFAEAKWK